MTWQGADENCPRQADKISRLEKQLATAEQDKADLETEQAKFRAKLIDKYNNAIKMQASPPDLLTAHRWADDFVHASSSLAAENDLKELRHQFKQHQEDVPIFREAQKLYAELQETKGESHESAAGPT